MNATRALIPDVQTEQTAFGGGLCRRSFGVADDNSGDDRGGDKCIGMPGTSGAASAR
jgi:hypothetical protein